VSQTLKYIQALQRLKQGDLGLLRTHSSKGLDESVDAFDLFAGLWWPLRQKSQFAPRREVAWLVSKLYAACPLAHIAGNLFAQQLARCQPHEEKARRRFLQHFDLVLRTPLRKLEPDMQWGLNRIRERKGSLDWVKLTDDLSYWERQSTRRQWAEQFVHFNTGETDAN